MPPPSFKQSYSSLFGWISRYTKETVDVLLSPLFYLVLDCLVFLQVRLNIVKLGGLDHK